jgi:hypothetical protein
LLLLDAANVGTILQNFELGAAIGMGKRIVSIVPREFDPSKLPLELRTRRYLIRDSPEDTAEELAHALIIAA